MRTILSILFLWSFFGTQTVAFAAESIPHYAVINNQVRGTECCDVGSVAAFAQQQQELRTRNLSATFTVRYDALVDPEFVASIKNYPEFEYGGLLEITPSLATAAGAEYRGTDENWFEAQHVFLVGYSEADRTKLIDTYMDTFQDVFDYYPKTTTAWMIDPFSLTTLYEYGVRTHQITREQFGTDSYTLYGGSPHYPYWSADDWALMPSAVSDRSPLIIRQTTTNPVYNYGDQTSAFTSQPNDYRLRGADTEYFSHLFLQAHDQLASNGYTFSMLGIENSLAEENQQEFFKQLDIVSEWQQQAIENNVVSAQDFYNFQRNQPVQMVSVYAGVWQDDASERAWWVTTSKYRARVRLSGGILSLTDLRIFDENFPDPYSNTQAKSMGWWIAPFILDGSRSDTTQVGQAARNDVVKNRPKSYPNLTVWRLAEGVENVSVTDESNAILVTADGEQVIIFSPNSFTTDQPVKDARWLTEAGETAWGFSQIESVFTSFAVPDLLSVERQQHKLLLFPELQLGEAAAEHTSLYINNRYAIAGRNPVRLVLFPKDSQNFPVLLSESPNVSLSSEESWSNSLPAHGSNGMIFIDIQAESPQAVNVAVSADSFQTDVDVYLAPNCAKHIRYCVLHPIESYWYVRAVLSDKFRFFQQRKQLEEQYL